MMAASFPYDGPTEQQLRMLTKSARDLGELISRQHAEQAQKIARRASEIINRQHAEQTQQVVKSVKYWAAGVSSQAASDAAMRFNQSLVDAYAPTIHKIAEEIDALTAFRAAPAPQDLLQAAASEAGIETVPTDMYEAIVADLEDTAAEDPEVAAFYATPFASLTLEQRQAMGRFIARWGQTFGLFLGTGLTILGTENFGDVLVWSAVLAVLAVAVWMIMFRPDSE